MLPGFVATEGFPQRELVERRATRWPVSTPDKVADAIWDAGPGGKAERDVPRPYWLAAVTRTVAPRLVRGALRGGGETMTPATGGDAACRLVSAPLSRQRNKGEPVEERGTPAYVAEFIGTFFLVLFI